MFKERPKLIKGQSPLRGRKLADLELMAGKTVQAARVTSRNPTRIVVTFTDGTFIFFDYVNSWEGQEDIRPSFYQGQDDEEGQVYLEVGAVTQEEYDTWRRDVEEWRREEQAEKDLAAWEKLGKKLGKL